MRTFWLTILLLVLPSSGWAQITVPNTFVAGTSALASEVNANFDALESNALNRTGGTITGNIVVDSGITIDGIDIGAFVNQSVATTGSPTFAALTVSGTTTIGGAATVALTLGVTGNTTVGGTLDVTGASTVAALTASGAVTLNGTTDVNSTFTIGSGNVQPFTSAGKIQAISSVYFDSLDGTNLVGVAKTGSENNFSAQNNLLDYTETSAAPTIAAGSLTLDLNTASHFLVALNANITSMTVSNVTSSKAVAFTIRFTADGTLRTVSWPSGTVWAGGAAPTMTSTNNKRDFFTFMTYDGGTTWFAFTGGQNF